MFDISLEDVLLRALAYAIVAALATGIALLALRLMATDRWAVEDDQTVEGLVGHFDIVGFIAAIAFRQSWLRPMLPAPSHMRWSRAGLALWVIITLAALLVVLWGLKYLRIPIAMLSADTIAAGAVTLINTVVELGVWFAVLNVLPIPPLLGSNFVAAIAPSLRPRLKALYWPGVIVLLLLMYFRVTNLALQPVVSMLTDWVLR